uniref:Uncharacterized protein n=1 Tax=Vitis vinifera TaxID=29760 RepID=F6GSK8_VITVI
MGTLSTNMLVFLYLYGHRSLLLLSKRKVNLKAVLPWKRTYVLQK